VQILNTPDGIEPTVTTDGNDGRLKAELIAAGRVSVPKELLAGYRLSKSTAGPGAGGTSLALGWKGSDGRQHQVKLAVAPEAGVTAPITLEVAEGGELEIRRADGSIAVTDVWLIPIVMHAPDQAFINLSGECIYECAFCNTHKMEPGKRKIITPDRWVALVAEAHSKRPFDALAITSVASPDHEASHRDQDKRPEPRPGHPRTHLSGMGP